MDKGTIPLAMRKVNILAGREKQAGESVWKDNPSIEQEQLVYARALANALVFVCTVFVNVRLPIPAMAV